MSVANYEQHKKLDDGLEAPGEKFLPVTAHRALAAFPVCFTMNKTI